MWKPMRRIVTYCDFYMPVRKNCSKRLRIWNGSRSPSLPPKCMNLSTVSLSLWMRSTMYFVAEVRSIGLLSIPISSTILI